MGVSGVAKIGSELVPLLAVKAAELPHPEMYFVGDASLFSFTSVRWDLFVFLLVAGFHAFCCLLPFFPAPLLFFSI